MIVGVLTEPAGENRVSLLPEQVESLIRKKVEVWVQAGAGNSSFSKDEAYQARGAKTVPARKS